MIVKAIVFYLMFIFIISCIFAPDSATKEAPNHEYSAYSVDLLNLINIYRTSNNLVPLSMDGKLIMLAASHSTNMHRLGKLSHNGFNDRFAKSGSSYCVENVGWNHSDPEDEFNAWKTSSLHNKNILDPHIRRAGISRMGAYVTFFGCN